MTDPRASAPRQEPLDLDAMKARCDAATRGPWQAENVETREDGSDGCAWGVVSGDVIVILHDFVGPANAEFIAHARMDVPNLIREVERLRAALSSPPDAPQPILAHVVGCPKALRVPVDLCDCGGRDFVPAPVSPPDAGEPPTKESDNGR